MTDAARHVGRDRRAKEQTVYLQIIMLALGVFLGNWLLVPIFSETVSRKDGFFIGVIAAILVLVFGFFFLLR